ncbi:MAG: hypothetical protein VKL59_09275 [Nostocaceae cyanobacterium]|nr:hypothetical protein [Nostocaceae cyanobacterium]
MTKMNMPAEQNNSNIGIQLANAGLIQDINQPLSPTTELTESGSIHKIRDILFGNQMRDYEKRFTRLEERLIKESVNLREETKKRLDSLEMYIKQEIDSLTEKLKTEQLERDTAVQALARESKDTYLALEKKLAQFDEQTTNNQRELRQQILEQSKSLYDEIRQKSAELQALLQQEVQELSKEKTDRSDLATMFAELAIRLNTKQ